LKSDFLDAVYLQQNAFDPLDAAVTLDRQRYVFNITFDVLSAKLDLKEKSEARTFFYQLRQKFLDLNGAEWNSDDFKTIEKELYSMIEDKKTGIIENAQELMASEETEEVEA
jgi:V/A-type H+-transporting ATPase subunit A